MSYEYAEGDLLTTPNTYQFSRYEGELFLTKWADSRSRVRSRLPVPSAALPIIVEFDQTQTALLGVLSGGESPLSIVTLEFYLKKFEVSKRLYSAYADTQPRRPLAGATYENLESYLLLALALVNVKEHVSSVRYLNGLLKLCDTLCAMHARLTVSQRAMLAYILQEEAALVAFWQGKAGL